MEKPISQQQPDNFNPRSHVGNDVKLRHQEQGQEISIHVPTWGTTGLPHGIRQRTAISIHVPTWGTTTAGSKTYEKTNYFNPRSHVGNDGKNTIQKGALYTFQSTFPRGERRPTRTQKPMIFPNFNPRSHVGNDSKFSQIFFAFLCNKYNFSTFYYPFSLFFGVIHFTFLIFAVRILPIFYVYF